MSLRLIFMGTPDFAVPSLLALQAAGHEIVAVYTREPKPGEGAASIWCRRRSSVRPAPSNVPVLTPKTLRSDDALVAFNAFKADAAVVVAYGMILPKAILEAPRLGCFNVHASLLPRWRGAAPINRAIMAGDKEGGVTIMQMDEGLDTGAMAMREALPIDPDMTAGDLHDALAQLGADLMPLALGRGRARHADADAAAGRRRHLCRENFQG